MHLNTKKIAFAGVMLALTEVGIALGSVIETNTLFLLAAASFFVGIVIQEFGLKSGAGFLLAGICPQTGFLCPESLGIAGRSQCNERRRKEFC